MEIALSMQNHSFGVLFCGYILRTNSSVRNQESYQRNHTTSGQEIGGTTLLLAQLKRTLSKENEVCKMCAYGTYATGVRLPNPDRKAVGLAVQAKSYPE